MFFFPYGTDAPVYYFPWGTIGLIVVNVLAFAAMVAAGPEASLLYVLQYGDGLHPLQWVTSNFMHGDIFHLVGNMVFLWSFALVVEGKLGPVVFVPLYLGLGITECAIEQVVTLNFDEGASIGASSIVCGLAAMSMIWAPRNDLHCFLLAAFRYFTFDVPILGFVAFYVIGQELAFAALNEFQVSGPVLHLFGATVGLVAGIVMLKAGWVDCENWDLFALWQGRLGEAPQKSTRALQKEQATRDEQQAKNRSTARETLRLMLRDGNGTLALALHEKLARTEAGWQLEESELLALLDALGKQQQAARGMPLLVEYLQRFTSREVPVRLKLAQLSLEQGRPTQALRVLQKLPDKPLAGRFEALRQRLLAAIDHQREAGAVEFEAEDW
ncbi:MAG: rhomboid family intramembrane serine protease [Pirellulales bacterium]|nr:rhomboid family intramembrane serine protease [Pirellulales bacterium]